MSTGNSSVPEPWEVIDLIWAKLSVGYGHRFLSIWDGAHQDDVKADWARELQAVPYPAILHALANLPPAPPDVHRFKALCREWRAPAQTALPYIPPAGPVPEFVQQVAAKIHAQAEADEEPVHIRQARRVVAKLSDPGLQLRQVQRENLERCRKVLERWDNEQKSLAEAKAKAQAMTDAALGTEV